MYGDVSWVFHTVFHEYVFMRKQPYAKEKTLHKYQKKQDLAWTKGQN